MLSWIPVFFRIAKIPYFLIFFGWTVHGKSHQEQTDLEQTDLLPSHKSGVEGGWWGGVGHWHLCTSNVHVLVHVHTWHIRYVTRYGVGGWGESWGPSNIASKRKGKDMCLLGNASSEGGRMACWKPLEENTHGLETDDGMTRCEAKQSTSQRTAFWEPKCWKGSRPQGKHQKHMMHFIQPKATLRSDKTQMLYNCGRVKDPARYLCIYFTQIRFYIFFYVLYILHMLFMWHTRHTPNPFITPFQVPVPDPPPQRYHLHIPQPIFSGHGVSWEARNDHNDHVQRVSFEKVFVASNETKLAVINVTWRGNVVFSFLNHGKPWWFVINN